MIITVSSKRMFKGEFEFAIFFDPDADGPCELSKLRFAATIKSFVGIKRWPILKFL
jgi:hypothetical protein